MKHIFQQLLSLTLKKLDIDEAGVQINYSRNPKHGDLTSNIALVLAQRLKVPARDIAEKILAELPLSPESGLAKVEVAGSGFINFFLKREAWYPVIETVLAQGKQYGCSQWGQNETVLVEFVSANPTGPLHVGHGRNAAYGDALARILQTVGYQVYTEYYVNDAGRQMNILTTSVWLRYLQLCGEPIRLPSNGYQGDYVCDIACYIRTHYGEQFHQPFSVVTEAIPLDGPQGGDKEQHIDALIRRAQILLGKTAYQIFFEIALDHILGDIKADLAAFQVEFNNWFSERSLFTEAAVANTIERLKASGHTYERAAALWFKSTALGDDKDRVLLRENGQPTYFAADAAYRYQILQGRGFKRIINVLGADHHGYAPRMHAVIKAMGLNSDALVMRFVQFVSLYRGTHRLQMSTRSGEFITLRALRQEVGNDTTRFFYLLRKSEQPMDFDLELAKSQSNESPLYYLQYAHARICSVMRQLAAKKLSWEPDVSIPALAGLVAEQEIALLALVGRYPETLEQAAIHYEPHLVAHYLRELARVFHAYYNDYPFLVDDATLRNARLSLIQAVRQVIVNGLGVLGICAAESM